jgi:transcriptional regulator with XRE-family HTH domain
MENPIKRIRLRAGLSAQSFAESLGLSLQHVLQVERGLIKTPASILKALASHGFDAERLAEEYAEFRRAHIEECGRKLQAGR